MAIDLVTLEEYKAYAAISSNTQDSRIASIIPQVSALVKSYCGRTFVDYVDPLTPCVQYLDNPDTTEFTDEFPVIGTITAEVSTDNGVTYSEFTDFAYSKATDQIVFLGTPPTGINCVKLTYNAGFATIPEDLKLAVFDLIIYYIKAESTPKKTIGYVNVEYVITSDMPSHIKRVLELYRNIL